MKLFVRNLSYDLTEDELKEIFEAAGTVASVKIIKDRDTGRSKGFGFVEMSSPAEGEEAIKTLNGYEGQGRPIYVDKARDNNRSESRR